MADEGTDAARERARVIGDFAARLRDMRAEAGNPSFREMAGRSKAISHTTLHEAAQGHRLPSWATVVEFAKACDSDPESLRPEWEGADRTVRRDAGSADTPADAADDTAAPARRRWLPLAVGSGVAALAVLGVVLALTLGGDDEPTGRTAAGTPTSTPAVPPSGSGQAARYTAADCPVKQKQPPLRPATRQGDKADFIGDITAPDCSHFPRGGTFTKIWRFKNEGSVRWQGYTMRRLDTADGRGQCQTIRDVPIPDTAPGRQVDVTVQVTAPSTPGFCFVRYRIVTPEGDDAFPGGRSINFQAIVD